MKGKNIVEKYFHQKDFSIAEIIVLILAVASAIVAIFIQGGGPIGLPALLVCICAFSIIHSKKIKDDEIEQIIKKIKDDNQIPDSDYTIEGYELKNTAVRKRKDGKLISPDYYVTEIRTSTDGSIIFNVYAINLIDSSVKMTSHSVSGNGKVTLVEETVKTSKGPAKMSYLRLDESCTIPVTLNDYKSSQLIESICN